MGGFRSRAAGSIPDHLKTEKTPVRQSQSKQSLHGKRRHGKSSANSPADSAEGREQRVDPARRVAYDTIAAVIARDAYSNLLLPGELSKRHITGRDAAFATEVVYGTLRNEGLLDAVISECSSRPLESMDSEVVAALRMGAYQHLMMRVEAHAAVDTTVHLARIYSHKVTGFVNAVMRAVTQHTLEEWLDTLSPDPTSQPLAALAFRTAHPEWIVHSFAQALGGTQFLEECLTADSGRPQVHLVARPGRISQAELMQQTGGHAGRYSPYAVYLDKGNPAHSPAIKAGKAAVQDEGSQLIALAFTQAPIEGEDTGRWLDLCAGPGGKTGLIASIGASRGVHVDAVELAPHRADLVRRTTTGLPVHVRVADGRNPGLTPGYDRTLVDAPCSGLGALRRRPEARWRKHDSDIAELNTVQFELLSSAVELTRPGGVIIYSTCSPDLRETRQIVDRAVASLPVEEVDAHHLFPMEDVGKEKSVQLWPFRHGTDAMFCAVLKKLP